MLRLHSFKVYNIGVDFDLQWSRFRVSLPEIG
jgi:hypothetical protein